MTEAGPLIRRTVTSADLDLNGHMNAAHYFSAHVAATRAELANLGVTEEYVAQRRMGTFAAEQHLRYLGELREGDAFAVSVQALDRSDKAIHLRSVLTNEGTGATANTLEVISVHVDLDTRRVTLFPKEITDRIDEAIRWAQGSTQDFPTRLTLRGGFRSVR